MTFLLAIFTIVLIKNSLNNCVIAVHQFLELLIFLIVENLFNFFNTFVKLFIVIGNNDNM